MSFSTPVAVTAGTTYVVSYYAPKGHYSLGANGLSSQVNAPPLYGLATASAPNGNGVFLYGSAPAFPTGTYNASNYFVDPVFTTSVLTLPAAPTAVTAATAGSGSVAVSWSAPASSSSITSYTVTPFAGTTAGTPVTVSGSPPATSTTLTGLTNGTTYTFSVTATSAVGTGPASGASNPATPESSLNCPCNIFGTQTPGTVDSGDGSAVNLGMAFTTDTTGYITGARFYKAAANTGTHVGSLWSSTGTLLAQATFTNETASGWQRCPSRPRWP